MAGQGPGPQLSLETALNLRPATLPRLPLMAPAPAPAPIRAFTTAPVSAPAPDHPSYPYFTPVSSIFPYLEICS